MKKSLIAAAAGVVLLCSATLAGEGVLTKDGKTTIVNTTSLTKKVKGYLGPTPVKIYIKDNKIEKIEPLKNQETPQYFVHAKAVLSKFEGKNVSKVSKVKVDAKTGATFSTKALIKNVQEGVKYYNAHK